MNDLAVQQTAADSTVVAWDTGGRISTLELMGQAGGFQWPILAVFVVGLGALMLCLVRLFLDRRAARRLIELPIETATRDQFELALQPIHINLHAQLLHSLLAVDGAGGAYRAMGQEIRSVAAIANADYLRTERLVSYCSSTAGGLGLLGTLVGIYTLFSAGARDPQVIFAGIAVAVVSTLLGLVASLLLELLETLAHRWASRYVELAAVWASRIRLRLMTLHSTPCADH